jgi:hypothetical protein
LVVTEFLRFGRTWIATSFVSASLVLGCLSSSVVCVRVALDEHWGEVVAVATFNVVAVALAVGACFEIIIFGMMWEVVVRHFPRARVKLEWVAQCFTPGLFFIMIVLSCVVVPLLERQLRPGALVLMFLAFHLGLAVLVIIVV